MKATEHCWGYVANEQNYFIVLYFIVLNQEPRKDLCIRTTVLKYVVYVCVSCLVHVPSIAIDVWEAVAHSF